MLNYKILRLNCLYHDPRGTAMMSKRAAELCPFCPLQKGANESQKIILGALYPTRPPRPLPHPTPSRSSPHDPLALSPTRPPRTLLDVV